MNGYTLTWTARSMPTPDGAFVRPDVLGVMELEEVERQPVLVGRRRVALCELFEVEGEPAENGAPPRIVLREAPEMDRLGARMAGGELVIEGDAGDDLGASMSDGLIRVHGRAGDRVGGPDASEPRGMAGGEVLIDEDAGDHVGLRMRRGLIAVGGECGASPGWRMIAGTIVLGGPADLPGLEMRRGTIVMLGETPQPPAVGEAFALDAVVEASAAPAMTLLLRRLERLQFEPVTRLKHRPTHWRFYRGDRLELNKGELIQWVSRV